MEEDVKKLERLVDVFQSYLKSAGELYLAAKGPLDEDEKACREYVRRNNNGSFRIPMDSRLYEEYKEPMGDQEIAYVAICGHLYPINICWSSREKNARVMFVSVYIDDDRGSWLYNLDSIAYMNGEFAKN